MLIQARAAQYPSDPRDAHVAMQFVNGPFLVTQICFRPAADVLALKFAMDRIVRTDAHAAKLVKEKNASVHADAFLLVKDRAARIQLDQQRDDKPDRRQNC